MSLRHDAIATPSTESVGRPAGLARSTWARLARVLRQDVWAKGPAGTLQTVVRMLRLVARWPAHRAWCRIVGGPTTKAILAVYPRIVYIHSFSYLFAGTTWPQRLEMVSAHYARLNRLHDAAFFEQVISPEGLTLWSVDHAGRRLSIALLGPCLVSRHHEGDLTLAFALDGRVLSRLAFSLIGAHAVPGVGEAIYIGQVQGTAGSRELIREATQLLHAVTPRDLLMHALAGAAEAWGVAALLGVPGDRLLSNEAWLNSSSRFDYARFWQEHGAEPGPQGHHLMRLPPAEKPLSAIAARHRGRTLAKRQLKQSVRTQLAAALRARSKAG